MDDYDLSALRGALDPCLEHRILRHVRDGEDRFFVVEQTGPAEASLALVRSSGDGAFLVASGEEVSRLLKDGLSDTAIPGVIATLKAGPPLPRAFPPAPGRTPTQRHLNALVLGSAGSGVGAAWMDARANSPGDTKDGRLACAWAVNRIVQHALGRPVGGGLSLRAMFNMLKAKDIPLLDRHIAPGSVVISPSAGRNVGHVGIVGEDAAIYSNSCIHGRWEQNFDLQSWRAYYHGTKGLPMLTFNLNPERFPAAAA